MAAWYIEMWVNAPTPVTSPIAHTRSAARIRSSTVIDRASSSRPIAPTPRRARSGRRPVAMSSRSATTSGTPSTATVNPLASWRTPVMFAPVCTVIPSSVRTFVMSSEDSGSSNTKSRGAASIVVTAEPKRRKTWPSSRPIAPPPITIRLFGTVSVSMASRLVQYGVSAKPSMGGAQARVPGLRTIALVASKSSSRTETFPPPSNLAQPRTKVTPLPTRRSTATLSSQLSVASSRMRLATGAKSADTRAWPAISSMRPASAKRLAARIIILEGTHPQ